MAVYLSPGVYAREIDISLVATGIGAVTPAFIGVAKRGPLNKPVYLTNAQQYLDIFGEPFTESYLGYAVLAYFEEGAQCYVERVGIEWEPEMEEELERVAIDTSGSKIFGWGRRPVFTGIDVGKINLRTPSNDEPYQFHNAGVNGIEFNDIQPTPTPTDATLIFDNPDTYTGVVDDGFMILITSNPSITGGSTIDGAGYEIYRNSDGTKIGAGILIESTTPGESELIQIGTGLDTTGLECYIRVANGSLAAQDSFRFLTRPNNRHFSFWVDRIMEQTTSGEMPKINDYVFGDGETFVDAQSFVDRFNQIIGSNEDYNAVIVNNIVYIYTIDNGHSIQLIGPNGMPNQTEAWAFEVGQTQYVWDIPRSYLIANDTGPFNITTANNQIVMDVIDGSGTQRLNFFLPQGFNQAASQIAFALHNGGVSLGTRYWRSYAIQTSDDDYQVIVETTNQNQFDRLVLLASASFPRVLRLSEVLNIFYPYTRPYRGYFDSRVALPRPSTIDPMIPASCDPGSSYYDIAACSVDQNYFQSVVGWFVATSPGTWINDYVISLEPFSDSSTNEIDRFTLMVFDSVSRTPIDRIDDVSFDKRQERYVGNVINPGSQFGGINGNNYINWEERPTYLNNDEELSSYEVRIPSDFYFVSLSGGANGIPDDPIFSSELDRAVIGNPQRASGVFAFENPEAIDINLLATPGFSSGAVIGQALQMVQNRGDVLYIVDPPYGLRPQQAVDWHNGMLTSNLGQAINSSYGSLYWSWLKIFDQFSGQDIWIPPSGHQLGVFARTERVGESWFAPAGLNRGRLITPIDVEYDPTLGERNLLYGTGNAVNPIVNFIQDGITVWGQRTLQRKPTALDRVNVRMLLIFIKKNLTRTLRYFVFEQNDRFTWATVKNVCDGFLADLVARRGLDDFRVVCDESNNTPERRDRNELWVSVYLKPTRVAEFIVLNLVVMRSDASFSAEEVLAAGGVVTRS